MANVGIPTTSICDAMQVPGNTQQRLVADDLWIEGDVDCPIVIAMGAVSRCIFLVASEA